MRYLMLVCVDQSLVLSPDEVASLSDCAERWAADVDEGTVRSSGSRLQGISDATTVRVRDGEVLIADGPFAETKEQIAGFDILECDNLDVAIEMAAKHPVAQYGVVELRPFWRG